MKNNPDFLLWNGIQIPSIGFGTWQIPNGQIAYDAVTSALKNGYRHIDTAFTYGNEQSVGKAVIDSNMKRSDIFVTSKLPAEIKTYKGALESFEKTLKNTGLESIDLYLIHAPWPWQKKGADYTKENIAVWKAMEEIYKSNRCRAIGVSNFEVSDLMAILDNGTIKPMVNQIRYFVGHEQKELTNFCRQNSIVVEGYSPLATGAVLENKTIQAMADKYNASPSQICIGYVLQKGVIPLPKSTNPVHIAQNLAIDFEISATDMEYLDKLTNPLKVIVIPKIKRSLKKHFYALKGNKPSKESF